MKYAHAAGKRKTSIAKATVSEGRGIIRINANLLDNYMPEISRMRIQEPLILAGELSKKVNINVKVESGGFQSQTEAVRLSIARALVAFSKDMNLKKTFLEYDRNLLVHDSRYKEQRKPNDSKARAGRQKSYR